MTIKAQSDVGGIKIFEDFVGIEDIVANTAASRNLGGFKIIGQGIAEVDSGAPGLESDALSGVVQLTTTDETEHSIGLATAKCLDVALMAPLVIEARVRFTDLDTKTFYFGLTDVNDDTAILEGGNISGATATLTLTASDLCGFYLSAELTEDEMWHMVFNGGTTAGETASGNVESGVDAVAGEWDVLRIEVDPNGTARYFVNGVLKQTTVGAVSTTTDLAVILMVEAKGAAIETVDVDYVYVKANRDWNA